MVFIIILICLSARYCLSEEWTIHVYTGRERFAGTDNNIFIRLFNSKFGYTHEHELSHDNWVYGEHALPMKNLFEYGQHDKFRIYTEELKIVEKISVRRGNFPLSTSDWFLEQIIVERNRDSMKFLFKCSCWLRKERPAITITVSSDSRSIERTNPWTDSQIIIIVLIISFGAMICVICVIYEYCRRRTFSIRQIQPQLNIENTYYPQLLEQPSAPPNFHEIVNSCEDYRYTFSSNSNTTLIVVQSTVVTSDEEEPPAYRELFPD